MSGETLRAFLAVDLPPSLREDALRRVSPLHEQLGPGVRWVPEQNLHLTLKFLGEVDPDRIPRLLQGVAAKLAREESFRAGLGGLGAFPSPSRARVIWLDVIAGASRLARLARKLDAAAAKIGVPRERRPYRAHLTVGRLSAPAAVPILPAMAAMAVAETEEERIFSVEEVVLYESRLSSTGAQYVPLAHLPLGAVDDLQSELTPDTF